MSTIYYNNIFIISGQPTPLVSRVSTPYFDGNGCRLGETNIYQLNGQCTGCSFTKITGAMELVTSAFSRDFGDLVISDDNGYTVTGSGCKVNSINFPQSFEVGIQDYVVEVETRPATYFTNLGIIEKKNDWSVSQDTDGNFAINHSIYAKGINTAPQYDNALANAKNFVLTLSGWNMPPLFPFFITGFSGSLDSQTESINRMEATYALNEVYIGNTGKVFRTIATDLTSGDDGIITVSVNGLLRIGKAENIQLLRQELSGIDIYGIATGAYDTYRGVSGLMPFPLSSGVEENYPENSLTFDVSFNDWPTVRYRHDYNVAVTSGIDGIIQASIDGNIQGLGKQNVRYDNAYNFYKTLNLFNLANAEFLDYVGNSYPHSLNPYPISSGTTIDRYEGSVGYNAAWSDKDLPITGSGVKKSTVSYSKNFPIRQVIPISIINSQSGLDSADLLWNSRGNISINGEVVCDKPKTSIDATGYAARYVNVDFVSGILCNNLCATNKSKIRLDSANISQSINKDSCTFSANYSFDEDLPVDVTSSYVLIQTLRL